MLKELLKGLSEEQIAKVKGCKSQENMLKVAKEEGIELTDDQLEAVSGGGCTDEVNCLKFGLKARHFVDSYTVRAVCNCSKCGIVLLN